MFISLFLLFIFQKNIGGGNVIINYVVSKYAAFSAHGATLLVGFGVYRPMV